MTDNDGNRTFKAPLSQDAESPRGFCASILDALNMAGVREIYIAVKRPVSRSCAATYD